ncbi:MAG: UvrD-helicase domain-containing protein [Bacteroidetes bacterium]|nr:UvrD-helicase domain-containing protein [Bacteroidota bacterium]MBU1717734.1 UvrD-helicase domain-containing protein [Bacteroidota bacterium]
MRILFYNDLDYSRVKQQFQKVVSFLENDDFISAEIKKISNTNYYRAKLDYENRLLFKFAKYQNETYALLLEVILNHEYNKSKFLRGAVIDEEKIKTLNSTADIRPEEKEELIFVNNKNTEFRLLDRVISFDAVQNKIFHLKLPLVIIGSAGSGKTVLTLEKLKSLKGNILYVTLSPYLVENSARLYSSNNYSNDSQEIDFLSYKELLDTIQILPGKELDYKAFSSWILTRMHVYKIKDSHKLFEEFRGVLTGLDVNKECLSREEYLSLGVKQSIFLNNEKDQVYAVFEKYLEFLTENNLIDFNIISNQWLRYCFPKYDYIVIDEVQDFTNIQLFLILRLLKGGSNFLLCGDSNQIVHPNFFSWTNVKTMFYKKNISSSEINILRTNYRNSIDITEKANKLLLLKNARFGSIDKESNYLVDTIDQNKGVVVLLKDTPGLRKELNNKTERSTKYALLVMKPEEKADIRKTFRSPLVFSIHEAKGLEYENIILVNFISNNSKEFNAITVGVNEEDLEASDLTYARGKDKTDKELEVYKFYINSLYVGITRATRNLYFVESTHSSRILSLLGLNDETEKLSMKAEVSNEEEWSKEARKLELQGKTEQAEQIRQSILTITKPDWDPITPANLPDLKKQALDPLNFNKKAKDKLFAYSLLYNDIESIRQLSQLRYRRADDYKNEQSSVYRKYYQEYMSDNVKAVEANVKKYGVDFRDPFNLTPLLAALSVGSNKTLDFLLQQGAKRDVTDHTGRTPLQIVLRNAYKNPQYTTRLAIIYGQIVPDFAKIKVNDRMIKIDKKKMEFFLLNLFVANQKDIISDNKRLYVMEGVAARHLEEILARFPESVLPDYRKKKSYISSILAKNEIDGDNPYNQYLFIRIDRGMYALNPDLEILCEENWLNVYAILGCEKPQKLNFIDKELIMIDQTINHCQKQIQEQPQFRNYFANTIARNTLRKEEIQKQIKRLRERMEQTGGDMQTLIGNKGPKLPTAKKDQKQQKEVKHKERENSSKKEEKKTVAEPDPNQLSLF